MSDAGLFRAIIKDDNGDAVQGPVESYEDAKKRLDDARIADWNVDGEVKKFE